MIFFSLSLLFMYLFSYLTTVEFSKNLDEFLKVPVNFIFLSHWFLTWQSWEGNFSRTPMHLLSRLSAWLFLWWSSVNSLSLVVNSVKSSLIITRLIIIVSSQGPQRHFEFGGSEKISGAATYIKFEFFRFCSINWKASNTNFKFLTIII